MDSIQTQKVTKLSCKTCNF